MMLYPEEHFWTVPTIPGLYDDNDYSGKVLSSVTHRFDGVSFALNTFSNNCKFHV